MDSSVLRVSEWSRNGIRVQRKPQAARGIQAGVAVVFGLGGEENLASFFSSVANLSAERFGRLSFRLLGAQKNVGLQRPEADSIDQPEASAPNDFEPSDLVFIDSAFFDEVDNLSI